MYIDGILLIAECLSIRHIRNSQGVIGPTVECACLHVYIHTYVYIFMSRFMVVSIINLRKI